MVFKELIFNSFSLCEGVVVFKGSSFLTVSPLGACGVLERTHF